MSIPIESYDSLMVNELGRIATALETLTEQVEELNDNIKYK